MKKSKKVNPRAKKPSGPRKPRPAEPFRLEVGKRYESKAGWRAKVLRRAGEFLPMVVFWESGPEKERSYWQAEDGKYWDKRNSNYRSLRLVREVRREAPRASSRGSKSHKPLNLE